VLYKKTTHYGIYNDYFDDVAANIVDWYNRHLKYNKVEITEKEEPIGKELATGLQIADSKSESSNSPNHQSPT
jgi:hypothetical protein